MADHSRTIEWLDETPAGSLAERHHRLGIKGSSIQTLASAHLPHPDGFVVARDVFERAIGRSGTRHGLELVWEAACEAARGDIARLARRARHLVASSVLDPDDRVAVEDAVTRLGATSPLAVRSSATPDAVTGPDCAGIHATFLGVVGPTEVIARLRGCWASLFSERALLMRSRGLGEAWPSMGVLVEHMVDADASGIATPHGDDAVLIEATFGLGEPIATGSAEPDRYVVKLFEYDSPSIEIGSKEIVLSAHAPVGHRFAPTGQARGRVLDDDQLRKVRSLTRIVWSTFGEPQEVEFAFEHDRLWLLQARRIDLPAIVPHESGVSGVGVGRGTATGRVRILDDLQDATAVGDGDVLVVTETTPEWLPAVERACALVTDAGDAWCHAARSARELGIPAVVGTAEATTSLVDGQSVCVDANRGWVHPEPRVAVDDENG